MLRLLAPALFVLIWSTGFVVGKLVLPHADLQFYLIVRLALTSAVMGLASLAARVRWPPLRDVGPHLLAGALMQGLYLTLSYWAITRGMAAGIMSLLGALQPLFTALFLVTATGARLGSRTWSGLLIGFAGVALVLLPKLTSTGVNSLSVASAVAALLAVIALTAGSLVQKWLRQTDIRAAASLQSLGATAIAVVATLLVGTDRWDESPVLWMALAWAVIAPSVIATTLLMWMLRHGEAAKVTALILLVPPLASVQAYFFFHETLRAPQLAGFAFALVGVVLARTARPAT